MFPQFRGSGNDTAWRAGQLDRLRGHFQRAKCCGFDTLCHAQLLDMGVGENLVDAIDRPARHAGFGQQFDPMRARFCARAAVDLGAQRIAVRGTAVRLFIIGVPDEVVGVQRLAQAAPDRLPGGGDVDGAVAGFKHALGNDRRMVVAGLRRDMPVDQPARGLKIKHENLRLQQRGMDPLSLAGFDALIQGDHDTVGKEHAGTQIVDRDADPHRTLARLAGDRHQPAHALGYLIESRPVTVRPVLAKPGNAAIDQARVDRLHGVVIDAEPVLDAGPVVFDQDIGAAHHALENGDPIGRLQVERKRALVALQVLEVGTVPRAAHIGTAIRRFGDFDLDDIGAPIGKLAHRGRPGPGPGQIEDGNVAKGR